ncbi:hypothetical protein [Lichenicoccus sp.]|uniref:hypothetical protein n=1 Tax=Lichenicoccus sp. TaxID=2781899 RepID=UPI003D14E306
MSRRLAGLAGVPAVAVLVWLLLAGGVAMQSYLGAWLALAALPLGALSVLMGLEAAGAADRPIASALRRILPLMIPAVLAAPVLERSAWPDLPGAWFARDAFLVRQALVLLAWGLLVLLFARAPRTRGRRIAGGLGLLVHVALVTLAATDWIASLHPGLLPADLGLVLLSAQSGAAASLAILLLPAAVRNRDAGRLAVLLTVLLAVWAFLHFTQFLIVWSADLPREADWYLARSGGLGAGAPWLLPASLGVAVPLLAWRPSVTLAPCAVGLLALHVVEMFWLVTPSLRGRFSITWLDLAALLAMAGVAAALLAVRPGRLAVRHAAP